MAAAKKPALGLDPRVASGTPEDVVREKRSYTGAFLKPVLARGSGAASRASALRRRSSIGCHCSTSLPICMSFDQGKTRSTVISPI